MKGLQESGKERLRVHPYGGWREWTGQGKHQSNEQSINQSIDLSKINFIQFHPIQSTNLKMESSTFLRVNISSKN